MQDCETIVEILIIILIKTIVQSTLCVVVLLEIVPIISYLVIITRILDIKCELYYIIKLSDWFELNTLRHCLLSELVQLCVYLFLPER